MEILNIANKAFLREHPFDAPGDTPAFIQKHSYIFPGDELVLYHDIDLPADAGASAMTQIQLIDMKISLVAENPDVFTDVFADEFTSTTSFELDSFSMPFTTHNAPLVPWGSDGYAPNINFSQDRNWQLPSGDFKRQINRQGSRNHTTNNQSEDYRPMM